MSKKDKLSIKTKLLIGLGVIAALFVGFFAYKYSYIYLERQKYNSAEVAIKKVAADLAAQGIQTQFSKGCSRDQGEFNSGSIFCAYGIFFKGAQNKQKVESVVAAFKRSVESFGFSNSAGFSSSLKVNPEPSGLSVYSLSGSKLQCQFVLANTWTDNTNYTGDFSCGDTERFNLF